MAGKTTPIRLSSEDIALLQQTKAFIESNLRKHHTIAQLASRINMNATKFKNGFRRLFGTGVFEHLHRARMEKGRELLLQTDLSVKHIGIDMGYPDWRSFMRAFKKYYGVTPGSLRK